MIWYLFILGLGGSLHCVGMCGALCIVAPMNREDKLSMFLSMLIYHAGRILVYIILGAIIGSIGHLFEFNKIQSYISILFGTLLLLYGMNKFLNIKSINGLSFGNKYILASYNKLLKRTSVLNTFLLGSLNGLIPCGLVYSAMALSFLNASLVSGMLNMLAFGLGTMPLLIFFTFGVNNYKLRSFIKTPMISGSLFILSGIFILYKSIGLVLPKETSLWSAIVDPILCH